MKIRSDVVARLFAEGRSIHSIANLLAAPAQDIEDALRRKINRLYAAKQR